MLLTRLLHSRRAARDDSGFTLVELLIGMMLAAIVSALMLGSLVSAQESERDIEEVAASQEDLRRALIEMTRDLRAAEPLWFDQTVVPTAVPGQELRLELWERSGTTPTYIRWHITGGELVRDIVEVVNVSGTDTVQTLATTYRLPGLDPTLTGFAYYYPDHTNAPSYSRPVTITSGAVDWTRLDACVNRVFIQLRAATLRGRHPSSAQTEINLRNRGPVPAYC